MQEYVPDGMVLPHGDPDIDADDTSRMRMPDIAKKKETAGIGHQPGGLAAYLKEHGLATNNPTAEPLASPPDDDDFELLDLDDVPKPSKNIRFPDRFDLPFCKGDDFDI